VLAAFELLRGRGIEARLCFAGRPGSAAPDLDRAVGASPFADDVSTLAPDEPELPALVARSAVLVHLVDEAWTPVTPLEALAAGAAVVATRLPSFEETLGDEATWVAPQVPPPELSRALERAIADASDPRAAARRRAVAELHTWDRCAGLTIEVWQRILARP
jgi:glycosyltransferase involved in cell wall biosynthesis